MSSAALNELPQRASTLGGFPQVQQLAKSYPALLKRNWIEGVVDNEPLLPVGVFMTLHALRIAYEVRKGAQVRGRRPLVQEVLTMLTFSFGGAILTSLALGRTQMWLENNLSVPVYAGVYLLMGYMPGDLLYGFLRRTSPVSDVFLASVDGLLRGYGVTAAGVDLVRKTMHGQPVAESLVAWVFVGTVLGSGGGIIDDVLQISQRSWAFRTPTLATSGFSLDTKLSFFATVGYILTTHAWSFVEHAPGFPLSPLLDAVLDFVPHLAEEEARLVSGLLCSSVLGTAAHFAAGKYAVLEKAALEAARRKKDDDADIESDDDDEDDADYAEEDEDNEKNE